MANKYSKSNYVNNEKEEKKNVEHRKGFGPAARIIALVLVGVMVVFTIVSAVYFLF